MVGQISTTLLIVGLNFKKQCPRLIRDILGEKRLQELERNVLSEIKLLSNALYLTLVKRLGYLLRCCMVILSDIIFRKTRFKENFEFQILHFE